MIRYFLIHAQLLDWFSLFCFFFRSFWHPAVWLLVDMLCCSFKGCSCYKVADEGRHTLKLVRVPTRYNLGIADDIEAILRHFCLSQAV